MHKNLISARMLSERWSLPTTTLNQWRWNGRGPRYVKLGRRVMYRIQDVEAFEAQRLRQHTAENNI